MVLGEAFTRLREMVQDPSLSFYDRECIEMVLEVGKKNYEELEQLRGRVIGLEYRVKRLTGENHDLQVLVEEWGTE